MARSSARWSFGNGLDYVPNRGWEKRDLVRDDVDRVVVVRTPWSGRNRVVLRADWSERGFVRT